MMGDDGYFQDLRYREDVHRQSVDGSLVTLATDPTLNNDNSNRTTEDTIGRSFRLLEIASMLPVTIPGASGFDEFFRPIRIPFNDVFVYWELAVFLAILHFNRRDPSVLSFLPERLQGCNLHLTSTMYDSQFSPIRASQQLYPLLFGDTSSTTNMSSDARQSTSPGAVVGTISTNIATPVGILSGVSGIPFVTPGVGSGALDQKSSFPTTARTVPVNTAFATNVVELLEYFNVTHAGLLYTVNEYGNSLLQELVRATKERGIILVSAGYNDNGDPKSLQVAMNKLKDMRYIACILTGGGTDEIFAIAKDFGLITPNHVWMLTATLGTASEPFFTLPRSEQEYADALDGMIVIDIDIPPSDAFVGQLIGMARQPPMQSLFKSFHAEQDIYDLYDWQKSIPLVTTQAYTVYDAVMALGIAACEANDDYFSPREHYDTLKETTFEGISGTISFDPITGTRSYESTRNRYINILVDREASNNETIRFKTRTALILDPSGANGNGGSSGGGDVSSRVKVQTPVVFRGGSTVVPESLAPIVTNPNLIDDATRAFGWAIGGLMMLLSLGLGIWTVLKRKDPQVRLSQPLFLGMMCFGTFIMALSIAFTGWQEPWSGLDFACMAAPWSLTLGFSTAFAALFTKTYRINKLFRFAAEMNRAKVRAKDVLWSFVIITVVNVVILTAWTLIAPLQWSRQESTTDIDEFGRSVSSFGSCQGNDYSQIFVVLLLVFNFVLVAVANWQSYRGRNIPLSFNESLYIAISMASLLEVFLVGGPILALVADNPPAMFLLSAVVVVFACLAILLPIYSPKFKSGSDNGNNGNTGGRFNTANILRGSDWRTPPGSTGRPIGRRRSSSRRSVVGGNIPEEEPLSTVARIRANVQQKDVLASTNRNSDGSSDEFESRDKLSPPKDGTLAVYREPSSQRRYSSKISVSRSGLSISGISR